MLGPENLGTVGLGAFEDRLEGVVVADQDPGACAATGADLVWGRGRGVRMRAHVRGVRDSHVQVARGAL